MPLLRSGTSPPSVIPAGHAVPYPSAEKRPPLNLRTAPRAILPAVALLCIATGLLPAWESVVLRRTGPSDA